MGFLCKRCCGCRDEAPGPAFTKTSRRMPLLETVREQRLEAREKVRWGKSPKCHMLPPPTQGTKKACPFFCCRAKNLVGMLKGPCMC